MSTSASQKPPRIQALARASAIIDVIAVADEEGVGLSAISKATELNKTTAFNLLASLVTLRLLEQDAHSRRYRLGLRILELGRLVQQRLHISHLARPILANLCRRTNETVNLGLPDLLDLLVIDSFQGSRILHASAKAGWRSMYHCTALGKAFMARWDAPMRQAIYDSCGLPRQTPHTMTEIDAFEAQLAGFREQGYAIDVEENEIGVNGIAMWIVDGLGEVAAAVSVSGHSSRLTEEVMERIAPDVINAADSIAAAIGGGELPEHLAATGRP
ncbi:MAG: IclR family transcriptional regulator [Proteobacteria bacterium]|nr:IclR family transcriptional regulator [Pseudomonadota bacterium]